MYLAAKVVSSTERSDSQGTSSRSQVHGRNGGEDQVCGGIRCRLDNNGSFTDGGVDLRGGGWEEVGTEEWRRGRRGGQAYGSGQSWRPGGERACCVRG